MPLLDDDTMSTYQVDGSGFQFSGVDVNNHLTASEYTLVGIACDRSTSVHSFAAEIEGCVKTALEGCLKSPRVDNLMVRTSAFNQKPEQIHGFRHLADCPLSTYSGFLKPGGTTALYDASIDMIGSVAAYGKSLQDLEYTANGIVVIITDGVDVGSTFPVAEVKRTIEKARKSESLESIITILIGINVNDPEVATSLTQYKDAVGFDQYVEVKDASPKSFAKIAGFVSKSVSSQSQALSTGSASQLITF